MNRPWAGSESYKISGLNTIHGWTASPVHSSSLPFCVRFNASVTSRAATLDTEPVASGYSGGLGPLVNESFPVRTFIRLFGEMLSSQYARSTFASVDYYRNASSIAAIRTPTATELFFNHATANLASSIECSANRASIGIETARITSSPFLPGFN
jgi:hypothetical protein